MPVRLRAITRTVAGAHLVAYGKRLALQLSIDGETEGQGAGILLVNLVD